MITKERLEELIEQGATIWSINKSGNINPVKTNKTCEIQRQYLMKEGQIYSYIEQTFETEEEAKWFAEFGCIARTQRLVLPTWEETIDLVYSGSFGVQTIIKFDKCKFGYKLQLDGNVYIFVDKGTDTVFMGSLTKENYTLACRKTKELFLGEKK